MNSKLWQDNEPELINDVSTKLKNSPKNEKLLQQKKNWGKSQPHLPDGVNHCLQKILNGEKIAEVSISSIAPRTSVNCHTHFPFVWH